MDVEGEVAVLYSLGKLYLLKKEIGTAIQCYESLLALAGENKKSLDPTYEMYALAALGVSWAELGEHDKALTLLNETLVKIENSNDSLKSLVLNAIGYCHIFSNQDVAIVYYEKALTVARQCGEKEQEFRALGPLGGLYQRKDPVRAIEHFEAALKAYPHLSEFFSEIPESSQRLWEAQVLRILGLQYIRVDDIKSAVGCFAKALPIFKELNKPNLQRELLKFLGSCYLELKQYERCIEPRRSNIFSREK